MTSTIDIITKIIKDARPKAAKKPKTKAKIKSLSKKAEALKKFINDEADFGCQKADVTKLVSLLIGESLNDPTVAESKFVHGTILKITDKNVSGHHFSSGTLVIVGWDQDWEEEDTIVNDLDNYEPNYICPGEYTLATDKEVKEFIANLKKVTDTEFLKNLVKFIL